MTDIRSHLQIVGLLLTGLGIAHASFPRYLGWQEELGLVSMLTRQIFYVHCFFIALVLVLQGACSFFFADELLQRNGLSRAILTGLVLFWTVRLLFQFCVYDRGIWRGKPFYTSMHVLFSLLWLYVVGTYVQALRAVV